MPQAKKARFVITGNIAGGQSVGDIVELEVGEDGKPVSPLMRSRTKPYRGNLPKASTAEADAGQVIEDAQKQAEQIIKDAEAKADKLINDAVTQADEIVKEASKPKK